MAEQLPLRKAHCPYTILARPGQNCQGGEKNIALKPVVLGIKDGGVGEADGVAVVFKKGL